MTDYNEAYYNKNMQMLSLAYEYCTADFTHADIINELYNDDDLKKQVCIIDLSCVKNQEEADILVFNLTEHSGPVRETASFKILELIQKDECNNFFQNEKIINTFIKSVTDINPSIARNACRTISCCRNKQYIYNMLIEEMKKILETSPALNKMHSYEADKKNFSLFWLLEAVSAAACEIKADKKLIEILNKTAQAENYTIREKTASAAAAFNIPEIIKLLENDDNIYVRRQIISGHIN